MKKILITIMAASLMSLAGTASAELFINPADKAETGKVVAGADYTSSEADYELSFTGGSLDAELDRKILSATVAYGVSDAVDVFAALGSITDVEGDIEIGTADGDGSLYAFGVRGVLPASGDVSLHWYGQYLSTSEEISDDYVDDYGGGDIDTGTATIETDLTEISVGVAAAFEADKFTGYAAGELVVSSDGDGTIKDKGVNAISGPYDDKLDYDAERDKTFIIRLGGKYDAGNGVSVNAGLALAGEKTFSLGVSKAF